MVITIDGPGAAGKSTVAARLASELGIFYLNTGILYRAAGYICLRAGIGESQICTGKLSGAEFSKLRNFRERVEYYFRSDGTPQVLLDGHDITIRLKDPKFDKLSSCIATYPYVRDILTDYQREIAKRYDLVAEGRDCGSVVFPHADFKFFLRADIQERAKRWQLYQRKRGVELELDESLEMLAARDKRDSTRAIAPLIFPEGAEEIDSTHMSIAEVVARMKNRILAVR